MTTDKDDLEPLPPKQAQRLFLDHKATNCTDSTVRNHRYRTKHFIEWCEEEGIDNLNELSGRDIQQHRLWRKETGDINNLTLRMHMSTLRAFLKWAGTIEAVPENLYNKVMVPRVSREERQRDEVLDAETAQDILDYLTKYKYASVEHTLLSLLWETGMRIGGANSIDLDDVSFERGRIRLVHRPDQGTTLKNGQGGERLVAMTSDLGDLLKDHIDDRRHDLTDDHGREPLFTTENGRMPRGTIRKIIYRITSPCYRGEPCPDCEERSNAKCPDAVCPHAIRKGSITHFLSKDVPVEIVSDRMNVSQSIFPTGRTGLSHSQKKLESGACEQTLSKAVGSGTNAIWNAYSRATRYSSTGTARASTTRPDASVR